jgi:SAM-dependent methyltransferase
MALFTILHEIKGERKYGIQTTGYDDLKDLQVLSKNKRHAYIYQPVHYYIAEKAFKYVASLSVGGAFVDFGCGEGRMLAIASFYGFKQIAGVEFAPDLCNIARKNIERIKSRNPEIEIKIFCGDAVEYRIEKEECVFSFFNPFDARVMLPVVRNILKSIKDFPRDVIVIYFNPTEKEIFLSAGFKELRYFSRMTYINSSILFKEMNSDDYQN